MFIIAIGVIRKLSGFSVLVVVYQMIASRLTILTMIGGTIIYLILFQPANHAMEVDHVEFPTMLYLLFVIMAPEPLPLNVFVNGAIRNS